MEYEGYVDSGTPAPYPVWCDNCGCHCNIGVPWGDLDEARLYDNMYLCEECYYEFTH